MMSVNKGSAWKLARVGVLLSGVLAVSACSFLKSAECTSSDTKELVASIVSDKVKERIALGGYFGLAKEDLDRAIAQIDLELNDIRTMGGGKDAGGFICEGNLVANLSQEQLDVAKLPLADADPRRSIIGYNDFTRQGFNGKSLTMPLGYRIQQTDDGDQLFGEVTSLDSDFINAYASLALQAVKNTKAGIAAAPPDSLPAETESGQVQAASEPEPVAVSAPPAEIRPSFNCEKASTNSEKLVCSDAELASLDVSLSKTYKEYIANSSDKAATKKEQVAWIKSLNSSCSDVGCLKAAYQNRISVMSDSAR